jgi:dsRNA-specific ribonuclease
MVGGEVAGIGRGGSKKEARRVAAEAALQWLEARVQKGSASN